MTDKLWCCYLVSNKWERLGADMSLSLIQWQFSSFKPRYTVSTLLGIGLRIYRYYCTRQTNRNDNVIVICTSQWNSCSTPILFPADWYYINRSRQPTTTTCTFHTEFIIHFSTRVGINNFTDRVHTILNRLFLIILHCR